MSKFKNEITDEIVLRKIYQLRDRNIMIDADLAELYGVSTTRLNEQVKRNIQRFPEDFMFQITKIEKEWLIENGIGPNKLKFSPKLPFAFTELGIAMLSSILNSSTAIQVNISIMRIFIKMRHYHRDLTEIISKIQQMDQQTESNSKSIELLFEYMDEIINPKIEEKHDSERKQIGFKIK